MLANSLYEKPLFDASLTFIPYIQQGTSAEAIKLWHWFSDISLFSMALITIIVPFVMGPSQRIRAIYYNCSMGFMMTVTVFLKFYYHSPRPFWVSNALDNYSCVTEFGNPSGHCQVAVGMALILTLDYTHDRYKRTPVQKLAAFTAFTIFGLAIAYSRMILGLHSID